MVVWSTIPTSVTVPCIGYAVVFKAVNSLSVHLCSDFSNRLDRPAIKTLAESDEHESVREIKVVPLTCIVDVLVLLSFENTCTPVCWLGQYDSAQKGGCIFENLRYSTCEHTHTHSCIHACTHTHTHTLYC